jgi:hypothetical protein
MRRGPGPGDQSGAIGRLWRTPAASDCDIELSSVMVASFYSNVAKVIVK